MTDDKTLKLTIKTSPISDADKTHWVEILPKLDEKQRNQLLHILTTKIDIAKAQRGIQAALAVIDEAESEAEKEIAKEDVNQKAKEEPMKEIDSKSPQALEEDPKELNAKKLEENQAQSEKKLADLRQELAQLSQSAHGTLPPSHQ